MCQLVCVCERGKERERERERAYDIRLLCHDPHVTTVLTNRASRLLPLSVDFPAQEKVRECDCETEGREGEQEEVRETVRQREERIALRQSECVREVETGGEKSWLGNNSSTTNPVLCAGSQSGYLCCLSVAWR